MRIIERKIFVRIPEESRNSKLNRKAVKDILVVF